MLIIQLESFPDRIKVESRGKSKVYIEYYHADLDSNTALNGVERAKENLTRIQEQKREVIEEYNEIIERIKKLKNDPVFNSLIKEEEELIDSIRKLVIEVESKRASKDSLEKRIKGLEKERDRIIEEILFPNVNKEELLYTNDDWKEFIVPNL